jgi:hypothetical protein
VDDVQIARSERRSKQARQIFRESRIVGGQRRPDAQRFLILRDDEGASDDQRRDEQRADDVPQ